MKALESISSDNDEDALVFYYQYLDSLKSFYMNGHYKTLDGFGESLSCCEYICSRLKMKGKDCGLHSIQETLSNVVLVVDSNCILYKSLCLYWSCIHCRNVMKTIMNSCRNMIESLQGLSKEVVDDVCKANAIKAQATYYIDEYASFLDCMKRCIESVNYQENSLYSEEVKKTVSAIKEAISSIYQSISCNIWKRITVTKVITCASQITGESDGTSLASDDYVSYPSMLPSFDDDLLEEWFVTSGMNIPVMVSSSLSSHRFIF